MKIYIWFLFFLLFPALAYAQGPPPANVVVTTIGEENNAENRPFIGVITFDRISRVSSEIQGLIAKVHVREGDHVDEGSALIDLNTDTLQKEIEIAKARIEQIDLRIQQADKNYKRLADLYKEKAVSEREYDSIYFERHDLLKEKQRATLEMEKLVLDRKKSTIRAPFAGVILLKDVEKGDWVQNGRELFRLASSSDVIAKIAVTETLLPFIKKDAKVVIFINSVQKELNGTILGIAPSADPKTKNIFVKIKLPYSPSLYENLSVTAYLPTSKERTLLTVPRDALVNFQGNDMVYAVQDDKAAPLPIKILTYLHDKVGIESMALKVGMKVVIEGNERLRPDQAVVIVGEK